MDPSALLSLREATAALPLPVAGHMLAALDSGRHRIGAFTFESQLTVCPVAAAAIEASSSATSRSRLELDGSRVTRAIFAECARSIS